jgi:hypothetical protein
MNSTLEPEEPLDIARDVRNNIEKYFGTNVDLVDIGDNSIAVAVRSEGYRVPLRAVPPGGEYTWTFDIYFRDQTINVKSSYVSALESLEINIADPDCFEKIVQHMNEVAKRSFFLHQITNLRNWENVPTEILEQIYSQIDHIEEEDEDDVPF